MRFLRVVVVVLVMVFVSSSACALLQRIGTSEPLPWHYLRDLAIEKGEREVVNGEIEQWRVRLRHEFEAIKKEPPYIVDYGVAYVVATEELKKRLELPDRYVLEVRWARTFLNADGSIHSVAGSRLADFGADGTVERSMTCPLCGWTKVDPEAAKELMYGRRYRDIVKFAKNGWFYFFPVPVGKPNGG